MVSLLDLRDGISVVPGGSASQTAAPVTPSPDLRLPDPVPALRSAVTQSPDRVAKEQEISRRTGIPPATVSQNFDGLVTQTRLEEIQNLLPDAPLTSDFLSDPTNAALAHDDVENLSTLERITRSLDENTPVAALQAFGAGIVGDFGGRSLEGLGELMRSYLNYQTRFFDTTAEVLLPEDASEAVNEFLHTSVDLPWYLNPVEILRRPGLQLREFGEDIGPDPTEQNFVTDISGGVGQISGQIVLALLTGGASTLTSLASMMGQGASMQAEQVAEAGATDTLEGDVAVIAGAGITALTERFGLDILLNKLPQKVKSRINRILIGAGTEASQEILEGVLHNLTEMGLYNPEQGVFDDALYEGSVAGVVGAIAAMVIPGRQAVVQKQTYDQMSETLQKSKLATREPQKAAEHVGTILESRGISEVHIPAVELSRWLLEQDSPSDIMFGLGVHNQIEEAIALGNDVTIDAASFARYILMSPNYEAISEHIRSAEDGMTVAESKEFAQSGVEQEVERVMAFGQEPHTETEQIIEMTETELGLKALFATAQEAGIPPAEYEKYLVALGKAQEAKFLRFAKSELRSQSKENDQQIADARVTLEDSIRTTLLRQPEYQVFTGLGRERLDYAAVEEIVARHDMKVDDLPAQKGGRRLVEAKGKQGLDPETVAQMYGFDDAETMILAIATAPELETEVRRQADRELRRSRPDLFQQRDKLLFAKEALHSDEMGTVLEMELQFLRDAYEADLDAKREAARAKRENRPPRERKPKKAKRYSSKLLKQSAKQRIDKMRIRDIKPSKLFAEAARSGKKASQAIRKGDKKAAANHKFQQVLNFYMAKEAIRIQKQVDKRRETIKKLSKPNRENLPVPYQQAIKELTEQVSFNLRFRLSEDQKALQKIAKQQVDPPLIPPIYLDEKQRMNYRDMTYAEFTDLYQTVKDIDAKGRAENKLRLETEQRERDVIAALVKEGVDKTLAPKSGSVEFRDQRSTWERAKRWTREARTLLYNVDTILREIDGFKDLGVAYSNLKRPYDKAISDGYQPGQQGYMPRQKETAADIVKLYDVYSKKEKLAFTKKLTIPGLRKKIAKHTMLAVMLNSGNDGNLEALVAGGQFTPAEVRSIIQYASKKDWDFVQSVWDYMDTFWPDIVKAEQRRRNYTPEKVEAKSIDTPHGTYRGGYYPIRYDRRQSFFANETDVSAMVDQMRYGSYATSHTARGHTMQRTEASGNPLLLDLFVINNHVDNVIYDLEVGDAITDIYKILHAKDVKQSFTNAGATHKWEALDLWLRDVVTGEIGMHSPVESMFRTLRTGFTISKLAWNLGTIALQPLGILQASVVLGKKNIWHGVRISHSMGWFGENSVFNFVESQSNFMKERGSTWNKDVLDAQRQLAASWLDRITPGNSAEFIRDSFFWGIKKTQRWVDIVTWLAAKKHGMEQFDGDEQRSIEFADRTVARSQASGIFGERTALERGSISSKVRQTELIRAFTPLISYFMAKTNIAVEQTKKAQLTKLDSTLPFRALGWMSDMMLLYTVEALLAGLIRGQWPDDDDDESFIEYTAKETANSLLGGIPIIREFGSEVMGFRGGSVYGKFIETAARAVEQVGQGEADMALFKAMNNTFGILFKYPSSQINKTLEAIVKAEQGEDVEAMEFIMGPHFDR